jgi:hypothetical protein
MSDDAKTIAVQHIGELEVTRQANWLLYEHRLSGLATLLDCPSTAIQDALFHTCIACNQHPDHILSNVVEFLTLLRSFTQPKEKSE